MKKVTASFLIALWATTHFSLLIAQAFHNNKIVAHRGAWKSAGVPQNSIASLREAIRLGCVGSEFDVRMTKDEVLVINHDAHYEGMDIEQTDFAELRKKPLKNGELLPTLEEYLKEGKKQKRTMLVTEIKPSPAGKERAMKLTEKVVQTVRKLKVQKWVVYISFDYDILKKVRELDKNAKLQYLNGNISATQLKADNIGGADYHFSVFQRDEQWLNEAKKKGIVTNVWTVNDTLAMDYFLGKGIDYITTDEPEKALRRDAYFAKTKRKLVWNDEFNYTGLPDTNKWGYDVGGNGWGNNELQYYTSADTNNAVVRKGVLTITARKQSLGNRNYTSARLVTREKAEWTYGHIEIRAKLPKGRGTWPAIWMLGTDIKQVGWPKCGEIDIMEHVGYDPDTLVGTIHTQAYNHVKGTQKSKKVFIKNPYFEFHVYAVDWTPEKMEFLLNGVSYLTITNEHKTTNEWPFDKAHYLLLNLAVGGNWGGAKGVDESAFPAAMEVDYVRVYQ